MNLRYLLLSKDIINRLLPPFLSTACQNTSVIILKTTVIFRREEGIYSINFVQLSLLTIILEGSYSIDFVHPPVSLSKKLWVSRGNYKSFIEKLHPALFYHSARPLVQHQHRMQEVQRAWLAITSLGWFCPVLQPFFAAPQLFIRTVYPPKKRERLGSFKVFKQLRKNPQCFYFIFSSIFYFIQNVLMLNFCHHPVLWIWRLRIYQKRDPVYMRFL